MNCTALLFRYLSDHIGVTSLFNRKYSIDFLLNLAYNHIHQWHSVRKKTHDLYRGQWSQLKKLALFYCSFSYYECIFVRM